MTTTIHVQGAIGDLRGLMCSLAFEIAPGVFVGRVDARRREWLKTMVTSMVERGAVPAECRVTCAWATDTERGFDYWIVGRSRVVDIDLDGFLLPGRFKTWNSSGVSEESATATSESVPHGW